MVRLPRPGRRRGPRTSDVTLVDESKVRRAVAAAAVGNTMEWYDFGVFSYITVVISQVFFPTGNPTAQLLSTFATFAVAFFVRPLGGFVFGPLGDRIGRQKVLAITMLTMAAGTTAIGLLPSYASVGMWAPVLLLCARLVQGFSTGGEYGGATTFVSEYAPDRRRGFMASWLEVGTLAGYTLGAAIVVVLTVTLSETAMLDWGWRIPFLVGGPLGLIGLYMRFRLEESPTYEQQEGAATGVAAGYRQIFGTYWRQLLICVGFVLTFNVTNYMLTAYMPTYLTSEIGFTHTHALLLVLATMLAVMGLVVVLGRYSDRIGRLPVIRVGSVALIVLAVPLFLLARSGVWWSVLLGLIVLGVVLVSFSSTMPSSLPALFPTSVRYGGVSIGFNISVALFGGTTPLVSEALIAATGSTASPALLLVLAGVVGLIAGAFARESARRALPGAAPTATTKDEARQTAKEQREDAANEEAKEDERSGR